MTRFHELPDGASIAYDDIGEGRPLILLHGVLGSRRFFARTIEGLAADHRVIAVDFRSHGESPPADGGHTVPQLARDVDSLLTALDLRDAIAVGWSMGNLVIWEYLLAHPGDHRLAGHVCISQGACDLNRDGWQLGFTDRDGLAGLLQQSQEDYAGMCAFVATIFTKELPSEADQIWMAAEMRRVGANAATAMLADQTVRDYSGRLPAAAIPTLGVWGRDEKCLPVASGEWLAERLPGFELHVFEESGHLPMWEQADAVNALIRGWVAAVPQDATLVAE